MCEQQTSQTHSHEVLTVVSDVCRRGQQVFLRPEESSAPALTRQSTALSEQLQVGFISLSATTWENRMYVLRALCPLLSSFNFYWVTITQPIHTIFSAQMSRFKLHETVLHSPVCVCVCASFFCAAGPMVTSLLILLHTLLLSSCDCIIPSQSSLQIAKSTFILEEVSFSSSATFSLLIDRR